MKDFRLFYSTFADRETLIGHAVRGQSSDGATTDAAGKSHVSRLSVFVAKASSLRPFFFICGWKPQLRFIARRFRSTKTDRLIPWPIDKLPTFRWIDGASPDQAAVSPESLMDAIPNVDQVRDDGNLRQDSKASVGGIADQSLLPSGRAQWRAGQCAAFVVAGQL